MDPNFETGHQHESASSFHSSGWLLLSDEPAIENDARKDEDEKDDEKDDEKEEDEKEEDGEGPFIHSIHHSLDSVSIDEGLKDTTIHSHKLEEMDKRGKTLMQQKQLREGLVTKLREGLVTKQREGLVTKLREGLVTKDPRMTNPLLLLIDTITITRGRSAATQTDLMTFDQSALLDSSSLDSSFSSLNERLDEEGEKRRKKKEKKKKEVEARRNGSSSTGRKLHQGKEVSVNEGKEQQERKKIVQMSEREEKEKISGEGMNESESSSPPLASSSILTGHSSLLLHSSLQGDDDEREKDDDEREKEVFTSFQNTYLPSPPFLLLASRDGHDEEGKEKEMVKEMTIGQVRNKRTTHNISNEKISKEKAPTLKIPNGKIPNTLSGTSKNNKRARDIKSLKRHEKKQHEKKERKREERKREKKERKREKKEKRREKFANTSCDQVERMNCFTHDNDHWKVAPLWTLGGFCFCQNANNNSYHCLRTQNDKDNYLYCEFITGFRLYQDLTQDPYQLHNLIHLLDPMEIDQLSTDLRVMKQCKGSRSDCFVTRRRQ